MTITFDLTLWSSFWSTRVNQSINQSIINPARKGQLFRRSVAIAGPFQALSQRHQRPLCASFERTRFQQSLWPKIFLKKSLLGDFVASSWLICAWIRLFLIPAFAAASTRAAYTSKTSALVIS